ncbi:MAG: GerW family sporulation protein, partial [Clostridiales bacterium]|nr:GerW family sporulation protein [Clostridiales bacterium]
GITLIPVSKVSFGFASGGSDFQTKSTQAGSANFGGGSGAGVNISPVAFLVVKDGNVKMISAQPSPPSGIEKVVEAVPEIIDKVKEIIPQKKDEEADDI